MYTAATDAKRDAVKTVSDRDATMLVRALIPIFNSNSGAIIVSETHSNSNQPPTPCGPLSCLEVAGRDTSVEEGGACLPQLGQVTASGISSTGLAIHGKLLERPVGF
jgi:hypothetical protein